MIGATWFDLAAILVAWIVLVGIWSTISSIARTVVDRFWRHDGVRFTVGP
jgi:hypothetical protein